MPQSARDRLVSSAIDLMARDGVAATGIADLMERGNVSRRTVYLNFPGGKSELVEEAARAAGQSMTDVLRRLLEEASIESALLAFGSWWADTVHGAHFRRGCPMVAATLGRSETPAAADRAADTFGEWVQLLTQALEADEFEADEARSLAVTIVAGIEGAVVLSLAAGSTDPIEQSARQLSRLVALTRDDFVQR